MSIKVAERFAESNKEVHFDTKGREDSKDAMLKVGYVEYEGFQAAKDCYCCLSCKASKESPDASTGHVCTAHEFSIRLQGCCNTWEFKGKEKEVEAQKKYVDESQRSAIVQLLRQEAKEWRGDADGTKPGDYLIISDANQLLKIAGFLEKNDDDTAFAFYQDLDPLVSGALAQPVQDFIESK